MLKVNILHILGGCLLSSSAGCLQSHIHLGHLQTGIHIKQVSTNNSMHYTHKNVGYYESNKLHYPSEAFSPF